MARSTRDLHAAAWYGVLYVVVSYASIGLASASAASSGQWELTFEDDFLGTSLNTSIWEARNNESHCCPQEPELYVASNAYVEDGNLVLKTDRAKVIGPEGKPFKFVSGWVDSKDRFAQQYGKFVVRASLPPLNATGAWPAHWLMPNADVCWPVGGEIDIMEMTDPWNFIAGSYRWGTKCGDNKQVLPGSMYPPVGSPAIDYTEYHEFGVEWDAESLRFFVDGVNYHNKTSAQVNIMKYPAYIIFDTAIAWYWMPGPDAVYPAYHRIDWVKVYKWVPAEDDSGTNPVGAAPPSSEPLVEPAE